MSRMKITDDPAKRVGAIIHNARLVCHMSRNELAGLLRITPKELAKYEHATAQIPAEILEHLFLMGYKMMRIRVLEHRYRQNRRMFRSIKQIVAEIP